MDRRQFDALIAQWGEAVTPTGPPSPLPAGYSGMVGWIWPAARGQLVAKGHLVRYVSPQRLGWVHGLCDFVHQRGLPWLPHPLANRAGQTGWIRGDRIWEVQTAVAGSADWCGSAESAHVEAVTRALATLHHRLRDYRGPYPNAVRFPPCLKSRIARLRWFAERLRAIREELLRGGHTDPDVLRLSLEGLRQFEWEHATCLARLAPLENVEVPIGPCLRDVRPCDVFFDSEKVAGFVDVMAADIDFPLVDLVRFWSELGIPATRWPDWLDVYQTLHPIPSQAARLLRPLAMATRLISVMNWIQWGALRPRQGIDREQVRMRLQALLE